MTTMRDVMVTALFTIGPRMTMNIGICSGHCKPLAHRQRAGTWLSTGLAPLRKARPWLARCGHPVDSAVAQIANCALIRELLRACRPQLDHDPAMQRAQGACCNEPVPRTHVADHRLCVRTPGAPGRGCTVHFGPVPPPQHWKWRHSDVIVTS